MSHEPLTADTLREKDFHRKYRKSAGDTVRTFKPNSYLGGGRSGGVYKYKHRETGEQVAVKEFNLEGMNQWEREFDSALRSIYQERNIYRKLQKDENTGRYDGGHPNVLRLFGLYYDGGPAYSRFVFELWGPPLRSKFNRVKRCLTEAETRPVIQQIASAVSFMHNKDICHRDLKMDNILCPAETDALHPVKVCDMEGGEMDNTNRGLSPMKVPAGSYHIADPTISWNYLDYFNDTKQMEEYNRRCDVYSLGTIMYKLLTRADLFNEVACEAHVEDMVEVKGKSYNLCWEQCHFCVKEVLFLKSQMQFDPEESYLKTTTSEPCKELISEMLKLKPEQRIHMRQVNEHRWFQQPYPESLFDPDVVELDPEIPFSDDEEEDTCRRTAPRTRIPRPLRLRSATH